MGALARARRVRPARRSALRYAAAAPLIVAAIVLAATALPASAQTPPGAATDSGSDLLAPSLQGNPAILPRFRKFTQATPDQPPSNRFAPPVGAMPVYGSPSGFGAGDTGFSSLNRPRKKGKGAAPAPVPGALVPQQAPMTFRPVPDFNVKASPTPPPRAKPLPAVIFPKRAATRAGAAVQPPADELPLNNPPPEVHPLAAANRPGAVLPVPPPEYYNYVPNPSVVATPPPTLRQPNTYALGQLPQQPALPFLAAPDPYAPLGVRAGSFMLFPSLDLSGAYSTNPEHAPGGAVASPYFVAAPELRAQSDWERHSLTADIAASYTQYAADLVPSLNVPFLNSKIDGRIDVTRDTQINLQLRGLISSDNPGSPNLQAQVAKLPLNYDVGDTVGIAQQFNRLFVNFKGTFDRATYDNSLLTDGTTASNADRNFDQFAGIGRIGYEIDPDFKPFIELQSDRRIHDEQFDRSGLQRDSVGYSAKVGAGVNLFGSLVGEMAVGYVDRIYRDPTLPNVNGVIADGALIWQPTALTTAKLAAVSQVYETVVTGASGELSRDINLEVDHAFRTWLIGVVKAGYGNDNYFGVTLADNRWFATVGLIYKLTREIQFRTELRQDWQVGTPQSGLTYDATSVLIGMRLQR